MSEERSPIADGSAPAALSMVLQAEQSTAEQSRAEQSSAEQSRAVHSSAEQCSAMQCSAGIVIGRKDSRYILVILLGV